MLFAIDHGNSAVKTTNFVFTSGLAEYPVKPPLQTDVLEWGGKFWALSGQRISFMRDKTRDDRFFILTLFAIAMELRKMGQLQPMARKGQPCVMTTPRPYTFILYRRAR